MYKVWLVAKGYNQEEGIDYTETFSHVVKMTIIQIVLTTATQKNRSLLHIDEYNAFLQGGLNK